MNNAEFEQLNAEFLRRAKQRNYPITKLVDLCERRSLCRDCDRIPDFYMVAQETWRSAFLAHETPTGCLCLNCLERRLRRRLEPAEIGNGVGGCFDGRHRLRRGERPLFRES